MYIESYKKLIVWQRAMELSKEIYKISEQLPKSELYGLVSQMRRCTISIPSNIAEGYKRSGLGEYVQFLSIADASAAELETQLILAKDLYSKLDFSKCEALLLEVQKMLITMIKKLKDKKTLNAKRLTLNAKDGQILIEAVVAITLITVGLVAIYTFISRSFSLNRVVADQYIGTYLAAEGIEVAKNLIDAGASPASGDYELNYKSSNFSPVTVELSPLYFKDGYYSYEAGGQKTRFTRKITIAPGAGADETKVVSRVDWLSQGGGQFNVVLEDHFYKWPTQ